MAQRIAVRLGRQAMGAVPSAARTADRSRRWFSARNTLPLILIWACFLLRGMFYSSLFPIWEGYDEWSHFAYIQHLVSHHEIPVASRSHISQEVQQSLQLAPMPWTFRKQPPLLTHDQYWKLPPEERARRQDELIKLSPNLGLQEAPDAAFIYEAQQPPLYYSLLVLPLWLLRKSPLLNRVIWLRWISILIASVYIPLGFGIARRVLRYESDAVAVMALSAAMPELLIELSRVGNESLGLALYTLLLLVSLQYSGRLDSARRAAALGLTLGAGLLTKLYFLTAVPALMLAGASLYHRKTNWHWRRTLNGVLALFLATILAVPWYWHNALRTGSWSGLTNDVAVQRLSLWERLRAIPEVHWANAVQTTFFTHIWFGNWSFLSIRSWMYKPFWLFALASVVGLATLGWRFYHRSGEIPDDRIRSAGAICFLVGIYGFFCVGVGYFTLLLYLSAGESSSPGWYFYVLVVPEVILVSCGLWHIVPASWVRWIVPAGVVCFTLLDLYSTQFLLIPYYTGLISHRADGALAAFHLGQLRDVGPAEVLERLAVNKPAFLGPPLLMLLWVLYLAATAGLVAISLWNVSRAGNRMETRRGDVR